ncbi:hypothetical protein AUJ87_02130 [Candidatus Gracilibacteria bacterium CG1_02_38_174]|nr:MAG: hypothetical protein AUJ87_02130 [Candidatus Gracilibacteria bacterium CG1_02_38_174]
MSVDFLEEGRTSKVDSFFPTSKIRPDDKWKEEKQEEKIGRQKYHGKNLVGNVLYNDIVGKKGGNSTFFRK